MKVRGEIPTHPVSIDEVMAAFPAVRQSVLSKYDECALGAWFYLRYAKDWTTHRQAAGIIGHRTLSECLRTMKGLNQTKIPASEALEILYEQLAQRDVPADEIVRVPLREIAFLRMAVVKWATDNAFTVQNIVAIEEQLSAEVSYPAGDGSTITRMITGTPDLLVADPANNGLIIPDWKFSWRPPTERRSSKEDDVLTYEGYFQQRFYGFLAFVCFPTVDQVALREFYPVRSEARTATLYRAKHFEHLQREWGLILELFDRALASGPPLKVREGLHPTFTAESVGQWLPSPGEHCARCLRASACPIDEEVRTASGAVSSHDQARRWAAEREVARRVFKHRTESLKPWVETHGPVPLKDAKGRRALGWKHDASGRRFESFIPDGSDRAPDVDEHLMQAMRDAVARERAERAKRPRRPRVKTTA